MRLIHGEISQLSAPREQAGPRNQLTIRRHAQLNNSTCWMVSMMFVQRIQQPTRKIVDADDKLYGS